MEIDSLIALADDALAADPQAPDAPDLIEAYCIAFAEWMESGKARSEKDRSKMEQLADRHGMVIERATALKDATANDLKKLKKMGKGIMAYTDTLPRSVSMGSKRKG